MDLKIKFKKLLETICMPKICLILLVLAAIGVFYEIDLALNLNSLGQLIKFLHTLLY